MSFALFAFLLAGALFAGMLVLQEVGKRIGARRLSRDPEGSDPSAAIVEGAVFALLGLLLAFTFSGASSRFDERRHLIIQEVNAIGTAWLRIDLLPPSTQPAIRDGFRRYLDARLAAYQRVSKSTSRQGLAAAGQELAIAQQVQGEIWANAIAVCRTDSGERARLLLLPALNEMFDIASERTITAQIHPPLVIFVMLAVQALVSALLAGYDTPPGKTRSWMRMVLFAGTIAFAFYVIIDLEYPRLGLIRVDQFDQALVDLRATMQ